MYRAGLVLFFSLCLSQINANKFEFYSWGSFYESVAHARLDPIISPGQVSGHVHTFQGSDAIKADATGESLAREGTMTSIVVPYDKSLYWAPSMYSHNSSGFSLMESRFSLYWEFTTNSYDPKNKSGADIRYAFPLGMKILGGNMHSRYQNSSDPFTLATQFQCENLEGESPYSPDMRDFQKAGMKCTGDLRATINLPSCWDGNPDNEDLTHVVYPINGVCPADHPKAFMALIYEYYWYTADSYDPTRDDNWVLSFGDTSGYGLHADFLSGWDEKFLQSVIDGCKSTNSFGIENCTVLRPWNATGNFTAPAMPIGYLPNEDIGLGAPISALPGCNKIWSDNSSKPTCDVNVDPPINLRVGPDLSEWNYFGCPFQYNSNGNILTAHYFESKDMTVDTCLNECSSKGYEYAGLIWGHQCYCDNKLQNNVTLNPTAYACTIRCPGNVQQVCGGNGGIQIYEACTSNDCHQNANVQYDIVDSIASPTTHIAAALVNTVPSTKSSGSTLIKISSSRVAGGSQPTNVKLQASSQDSAKTSATPSVKHCAVVTITA